MYNYAVVGRQFVNVGKEGGATAWEEASEEERESRLTLYLWVYFISLNVDRKEAGSEVWLRRWLIMMKRR